jgi:hypothetical protein
VIGRLGIVALLLFAAPGWAQQATPAQSGKQLCFNEKEAEAEAEVRTGMQIREILRRCALADPVKGQAALEEWYRFDQEHGDRLRAAVELRRQAISRIYPNRGQMQQWETDSVVATIKAVEVNDGVCKQTYDLMDRLKTEKWAGFKYYARLGGILLREQIPLCR